RRADHRDLERIVHDWRHRQHRGAVGRADDCHDLLALDELTILRDSLDRVVLVITRDQHELATADTTLGIDLVDGDLGAAFNLDAHKRCRPAQRAGKPDLYRLLRLSRSPCPE